MTLQFLQSKEDFTDAVHDHDYSEHDWTSKSFQGQKRVIEGFDNIKLEQNF